MTLPASGPISLLNLQEEFGGANPIAINEYYAGGLFVSNTLPVPSAGSPIALDAFYGASSSIAQGGIFKNQSGADSKAYLYANGTWIHMANGYIRRSQDLKTEVLDTYSMPGQSPKSFNTSFRNVILGLGGDLLMPTTSAVCRSSDNGATWTAAKAGVNPGNSNYGVKGSLYGSEVLAFFTSATTSVLCITSDGGASWQSGVGSYHITTISELGFCPGIGMSQGGDGLFFMSGVGAIATAPDAKVWTSKNVYDSQTGSVLVSANSSFPGLAVGNGLVVAISKTGQPVLPTDSSVSSFTQYPRLPNAHATIFTGKIAFGHGYFLVVGPTSLAAPEDIGAWTSIDGLSWIYHRQLPLTGLTVWTLDYADGKFYVQMSDGSAWAVNA